MEISDCFSIKAHNWEAIIFTPYVINKVLKRNKIIIYKGELL